MKGRESGMPGEDAWAEFFDADAAMALLWPDASGDVVELGSGYGTFTVAAAKRTTGRVNALDIEPEMVAHTQARASALGLSNVHATLRDIVTDGLGLVPGSQSHAMVYNLLHLEEPVALLRIVREGLRPGATISVMHWRVDMPTPRGPSLSIRPSPGDCRRWLEEVGFSSVGDVDLGPACPFHYGLVARR
ncbi:MAG: hypothetical protein GAK28_00512 [Luteibacter sp.]|uniref:class I SAM-dependent methyltransferase n=1 Tax=Luteibacter sp. TaxID=1886636 RepID=UPI00137D78A4|nr:class I SAM-dependent methyltransferase [Luteibacter sp.]KAF1008880.1 MAG: hypothetical protein GAK28_00512 [Luteibacter sp.]